MIASLLKVEPSKVAMALLIQIKMYGIKTNILLCCISDTAGDTMAFQLVRRITSMDIPLLAGGSTSMKNIRQSINELSQKGKKVLKSTPPARLYISVSQYNKNQPLTSTHIA